MSQIHPYVSEAVELAASRQHGRKMGAVKLLPVTIKTLEFLIQSATMRVNVSYRDVSQAFGFNNAQWGNISFGPIGQIIRMMTTEDSLFPYRDIPDLTAIVSQQGRGTPGRGFFAGHSELTNKGKVELKIFASRAQEDVFRWPHWTEFAAFLGITPMSALAPPRDELSDFEKISNVSRACFINRFGLKLMTSA